MFGFSTISSALLGSVQASDTSASDTISTNRVDPSSQKNSDVYSSSIPETIDHVPGVALASKGRIQGSNIGPFPPEILLGILGLACSSLLNFQLFPLSTNFLSPLFLGKICRGWRALVWTAPDLWTVINLALKREHYATQVQLFQAWLMRSQMQHARYGLAVTIHGTRHNEVEWDASPPTEIFQLLARVCHNLYHLDTFIPASSAQIFNLFTNRLHMLTDLIIRPPSGVIWKNSEMLTTAFDQTPNLCQLSIESFGTSNLRFRHHALQHVDLFGCYMEDFLKGFCSFPSLVSARLRIKNGDSGSISQGFYSPYLQQLTLITYNGAAMRNILSGLDLPALTSLSLSLTEPTFAFPLSELEVLMRQSTRHLQSLTLTRGCIRECDLIPCLEVADSLVELTLEPNNSFGGGSLSEISLKLLGVPCFCCHPSAVMPRLERFYYKGPIELYTFQKAINSVVQWFSRPSKSPGLEAPPAVPPGFTGTLVDALRFRHEAARNTNDPADEVQPQFKVDSRLCSFTIISKTPMDFSVEAKDEFRRFRREGMDLWLEFGGVSV